MLYLMFKRLLQTASKASKFAHVANMQFAGAGHEFEVLQGP
jgi:hypothetical protein